ncbi:MAG: DNA alkylation repair protein [Actinomycetota bacterium]
MMREAEDLVARLRALGSERNRSGMARFGINVEHALGVSVTEIRRLARAAGRDHRLASALWKTGIHEARILASMVEDPAAVTPAQMDRWARAFDSWDVCDQVCMNLFDKTPYAWDKAVEWSAREAEFVKRAGFSLMASLASHDRESPDARFGAFLEAIEREAADDRNFVRKAVNWALRGIGKRNASLNGRAVAVAVRLKARPERAARWIGSDALRELQSEAVRARLAKRG